MSLSLRRSRDRRSTAERSLTESDQEALDANTSSFTEVRKSQTLSGSSITPSRTSSLRRRFFGSKSNQQETRVNKVGDVETNANLTTYASSSLSPNTANPLDAPQPAHKPLSREIDFEQFQVRKEGIPFHMPRPVSGASGQHTDGKRTIIEGGPSYLDSSTGRIHHESGRFTDDSLHRGSYVQTTSGLVEQLEKWASSTSRFEAVPVLDGVGSPTNAIDSAIGSSLETMSPVHASDSLQANSLDQWGRGRGDGVRGAEVISRRTTPTVIVQVPADDEDDAERVPRYFKSDSITTIDSDASGPRGRSRRARPLTWSAGSGHFEYMQSLSSMDPGEDDGQETISKKGVSASLPLLNSSRSSSLSRSRSRSDKRGGIQTAPIIVSTNFGAMVIDVGGDEPGEEEDGSSDETEESDAENGNMSREVHEGDANENISEYGLASRSVPSPAGSQKVFGGSRSELPTRPLSPCSDTSSKVSLGPMQTRLTESPLPKEMDLFFRELEDMLADSNRNSPCSSSASTPCLAATNQKLSVHHQVETSSSFSIPRAWSLPHGELHRRYTSSAWLNPNQPPSASRSRQGSVTSHKSGKGFLKVHEHERTEICPWESLESIASKNSQEESNSSKVISRSMPSLAARRDGGGSQSQISDRLSPSRENSKSKEKRAINTNIDRVNLTAGLSFPKSSSITFGQSLEGESTLSTDIFNVDGAKALPAKPGLDSAYASADTEITFKASFRLDETALGDQDGNEDEGDDGEASEPLKRESSLKTAWKSMRTSIFKV
ncbi:hypothetical protein BC829DRAFT_380326 [Chytridium lagenaria]|nr:hypothetical protein BC829DRAFT_380326 [Chytridium lagenaria]